VTGSEFARKLHAASCILSILSRNLDFNPEKALDSPFTTRSGPTVFDGVYLLPITDEASTWSDLRLSHTCDCFDRFCAQAPPTTSIEFPAAFAVISIGGFTSSRAPVAFRKTTL
jgi:hypothetical protein